VRGARYGIAAIALLCACRSGEVVEGPQPRMPQPTVRIGITLDTTSIDVSATTGFELRTPAGNVLARSEALEIWIFTIDGGRLWARKRGFEAARFDTAVIIAARDSGLITISGKNYRGTALVRITDQSRISAINVVDIEEYLKGVVPFEIGRLPPAQIEAVKAQAVAARTYAIGNLNRWGARGFDFVATVQDQVYGGVTGEDTVASRAVEETRGEIVTYDNKPILAYYSSTCGGRTANIEDSWPWRTGEPYLKSVSDTIPGTDRAYCDTSNRYRWTAAWTQDSLRLILERTLTARMRRPIAIRRVANVELTGRSPSGRALSVRLRTDADTFTVPADSIRWTLRPTPSGSLNSALILDLHTEHSNEVVSRLEIRGAGWGHGIGMCQVGAIGRARAGHSYRDILTAYYSGTAVQRVY
jgi:stage II sporulation protein D